MHFNINSMNKFFIILIIFITSLLLTPILQAADLLLTEAEKAWLNNHAKIIFSVPTKAPPLYFLDDQGVLAGINIDYMRLLAKRVGLNVEFKGYDTWNGALEDAKKHIVDGIPNTDATEDRKPYLNFTNVYYTFPQAIITKKDYDLIKRFEDVSGKRIAVKKSSSRVYMLKDQYPESEIVQVDHIKIGLDLLVANKVDALYVDLAQVDAFLTDKFYTNLKYAVVAETPPVGLARIGLKNNDPILLQIFNKAIASISSKEHRAIKERWLPIDKSALEQIIELTVKEEAWLAAHPVIRVGADPDWGPIEFRNKKGNYTGLAIDYLKKTELLLGIRFEFVPENWQELIRKAKKQEIDIFSCVAKTLNRSEYLTFTEPYITMPTGVFAKEEVSFISDIDKLAGKKIAVVESYAIHDHIEAKHLEINLLLIKNPQEGIQAVLEGKAFAYIDNAITTGHLLNRKGVRNINLVGEIDFKFVQRIGVRKDWQIFTGILQKAIDSISEAELNAMYNQWVPVTYKKPTNYSLLWKIGAGCLTFICLIIFWNRRLKSEVLEKTAELASSEERLTLALDSVNDAVWDWNIDTNDVYFSPKWYTMLDYQPYELPEKFDTWRMLHHPEDLQKSEQIVLQHLESGLPFEIEFRMRTKGNQWKWVLSRGKTVERDAENKPKRMLGTHIDITERKNAENELLKQKQKAETYLNLAGVMFISLDIEGKVTIANRHACKVLECREDEIVGKNWFAAFIPAKVRQEVSNVFKELVVGNIEPVKYFENNIVAKSGKEKIIEWHNTYLTDSNKNIPGILSAGEDITDKRRLEKQLQQTQKMESIGRLAGGVAHDFNNMLTIILGNTEILMDDLNSTNPLTSILKEIQKAAQRSTDLTRQLLTFARKQTISPKVLNLNSTIEGMLKMLRRLIGEDINLSWHPMKNLWPVKIDPSQVDQILANLCVNARDSIRDVGKISIKTENVSFDEDYCKDHPRFKFGEYIMLTVSDTGCGMDNETLNNIFEPFFTTKELGEGTGLGLAMIYGIVKQNNGFINVYSEVEQGTTFKTYVPRYTEKIKIEKQAPDKKKIQKGYETILLVEDEKAILEMTKIMLERMGYTVLAANRPDEAIQISTNSESPIHLLMTDVVMPSMNGRDLSEKILKSFPEMKCLYMSGYTANVIAHRGILDEGLYFISKPFSRQELSLKLRVILDETHK